MTDDTDEAGYEPPERELFEDDPVGHATVAGGMTVAELVAQYGDAGIGAAAVHEATDVTAEMLGDDDCTVFLSLAGAMVPTGMRRIVADLIRDGYVDALVTTGANLTHDAIEAIGGKHHHGEEGPGHAAQYDHEGHGHAGGEGGRDHGEGEHGHDHGDSEHDHDESGEHGAADDTDGDGDGEPSTLRDHDEQLRAEEVDRIYNVYLPQEHFALFEDHLREEVFPPLAEEGTVSIARLCAELGRANAAVNEQEGIDEGPGVAAAAYEADVPIYCPAVQDSVLGLQAWMYTQTSDMRLDATADMTPLTDQAFDADAAGCLLVGGGVPKNFTLQTMLVTPRAYDYAVQITMDPEATGGLSGATLDEARSWGKLEENARNASVYGDATVFLPLLVAAARERIEG
ncbi:deoxyhypusine synthase [Halobaculum sp. MBLA0143]|uniref:deoxyhypusine synthase n=1 Tax=Halobaculum sp. MBLA0143 TaxID=3079933 RepID=UPI003524FAE1